MKRIVRVVGILVAVLLVAVIAIPFFVDANTFRPRLETELSAALARDVKVGNLKLSVLSGSVTADDLSIADDPTFSRNPFLKAKSLGVGVELWPLIFSRKLHVTAITIDEPEIVLLQSSPGDWNFSKLGSKSTVKAAPAQDSSSQAGLDLSVNLVKITNGRVSVGKAYSHTKPLVLDKVNVELRDFSPASVMPFSLSAKVVGGGEVKLDGKAGPINSEDVVLTAVNANVAVNGLNLAASEVVDPASGIAGLVSVDGSGDSNGKRLEVKGRVKAEKIKLTKGGSPAGRPFEFDFTLDHDLMKGSGVLQRGDVHIGKAAANLTGTYVRRGEAVVLNVNLAGSNMPVSELEAMLPALNIQLPRGSTLQGGTAMAKVNVEGPYDNLAAAGTMGMSDTRLTGFDLGSKMAVIETLAGIKGGPNTEIQTFSVTFKTANEATTVEDIKLIAPAIGELAGAGTVSAAHALDFKMRVAVHTGGALMTTIGQRGDTTIPFFIRGTSSAPTIAPDLKGIARQQIKGMKGDAVKAAGGILDGILGKKK